jgi:hypothetical protein
MCAASFMELYEACGAELAGMPGFAEFAARCPAQGAGGGDDAAAPVPGSFEDRALAMVIGAFVADAAAMPFHWIYSASQIARTVGRDSTPEFYASPQVQWYSYTTGELSPFGQQGMVYLRTLAASTHKDSVSFVDPVEIADAYYAYYGGTGPCASSRTCYHDACTRGFVANMRAGRAWPSCGANDDQDEAITHLIPVVALLAGRPEMLERCADAVRVIQNTDRAVAFGSAPARRTPSPPPSRRCATPIAPSRRHTTRISRRGSSAPSRWRTAGRTRPPPRRCSAPRATTRARSIWERTWPHV